LEGLILVGRRLGVYHPTSHERPSSQGKVEQPLLTCFPALLAFPLDLSLGGGRFFACSECERLYRERLGRFKEAVARRVSRIFFCDEIAVRESNSEL